MDGLFDCYVIPVGRLPVRVPVRHDVAGELGAHDARLGVREGAVHQQRAGRQQTGRGSSGIRLRLPGRYVRINAD